MTGDLYRIVYCSRNLIRGGDETIASEVQNILAKSRHNNQRVGITGALLFNAGSFAQVLEGRLSDIERTFELIQRDLRHSDVTVVQIGPIAERQFPSWSMAFAGAASAESQSNAAKAFDSVFSNRPEGDKQILDILQELVVSDIDWVLLDAA